MYPSLLAVGEATHHRNMGAGVMLQSLSDKRWDWPLVAARRILSLGSHSGFIQTIAGGRRSE